MKWVINIFFLLIPVIVCSQEPVQQHSLMDSEWTYVGDAGFSDPGAICESLVFGPSGEPYVAYCYQQASVMKFDGTNWVAVGNANFSAGSDRYTSLAFSPSGEPYVAFYESNNSYAASVMKFDSAFVGINHSTQSKLFIYPDPVTNTMSITNVDPSPKGQVSIMNLNGQEVLEQTTTQSKTVIDIGLLPRGVYFVKVSGERTIQMGKIIKE